MQFTIDHSLFPSPVLRIAFAFVLLTARGVGAPVDLNGGIPDSIGVNIHFVDPRPGEMEMLASAGIRWVRMDFAWDSTERAPGEYDFSAYDHLVTTLESYKLSPYFILDYSNKLYDNGLSPYTEEGRRAFAKWAAAAVEHFQGRGIIWEMYNEPNYRFWSPKPNVHDYILLALEVGEAIRTVAPQEAYVGPATSLIDFSFLGGCFKAGLLNYWSGVSVHPYRQRDPESVTEEFQTLQRVIRAFCPPGKPVPIIAGEWGYSSTWYWKGMDETKQGKLLAREFLSNLAQGVPLTVWYDWQDDSANPQDPESHFGLVGFPYAADAHPVHPPKPTYFALKTLTSVFNGYRFSRRLPVGGADDYVLLFTKGTRIRIAAWTTSAAARKVTIPNFHGQFSITDHVGRSLKPVSAHKRKLEITLADAPQYLVPGSFMERNPN
jgi:hypothetical protein